MKPTLLAICTAATLLPAQQPWNADEAGNAALLEALRNDRRVTIAKPKAGTKPEFDALGFVSSVWRSDLRESRTSETPYRDKREILMLPNDQVIVLNYMWSNRPGLRHFASDGTTGRSLFTAQAMSGDPAGDAAMPANDANAVTLTETTCKGRDGRTWQPIDKALYKTVEVRVRDEAGKPFEGVFLTVGPAEWFAAADQGTHISIDHLGLPAAVARAKNGTTSLRGIVTKGLYLGVRHPLAGPRRNYLLAGVTAQRVNGHIEVRVPRLQLQAMQCSLNESGLFATLQSLCSGQAQCQASGVIDVDADGHGEFAFFAELAGAVAIRAPAPGGETKIYPRVMSETFGKLQNGCVARNGYLLQMFLPGKRGWVAERTSGGGDCNAVDVNRAERDWRCYAWPLEAGKTGARAFFVDQSGKVCAHNNKNALYSGFKKRPTSTARIDNSDDWRPFVPSGR